MQNEDHLVPTLRVGTELCDALRRKHERWGEVHLVPTLRVGTELCNALRRRRERWGEVDDRAVNQPTRSVENMRSHAERGNEITARRIIR